jgi:ATP-binding cassette subfamily B protein
VTRGFLRILGPQRGRVYAYLAWVTVYGVLHGVAMILLVPISVALFDARYADAGRWLGALAVVVVVAAVAQCVQSSLAIRMALTTMRLLHHRLGDHMVTLPLGWFTRETVGRVPKIAVKGTVFVGTSGANLITPVVLNTMSAATVTVGLFLYDWRIGLVALVGGSAAGGVRTVCVAVDRKRRDPYARRHRPRQHPRDRVRPVPGGAAGVRPHRHELRTVVRGARYPAPRRPQRFVAIRRRADAQRRCGAGSFLGADRRWRVDRGRRRYESGHLGGDLRTAARSASPLSALAELGSAMRMAATELPRITSVLETPSLPEPSTPKSVSEPGRVELDHVAFSYPGRQVLSDISFTAEPGTMTALVGPSGSGKTTITRLIARFYDVDGGVVRVGGVDVRDQCTADLMAQLSLVFQDVYLFDDTLWENIRIGRPDASDADIEEAARTAGLLSVIERLPNGRQTRVGEGGSALSGGERQRVSIARALLKNAPIVLFDEATSALDPENEDHVADSIRRLAHGSTVIVIAHKLSR